MAALIDYAQRYMRTFAIDPHRGTEHTEIWPDVRTVSHKNFIFYFEFDDSTDEVRILAIFFGGVDHSQQIVDQSRS